jgi:serine O-acetyltransferase
MSPVILALYRMALRLKRWHVPVLPDFIKLTIRTFFGCYIGLEAQIGRFTQLARGGVGTVIHSGTVIGRNVYIGANVTIGGRKGAIQAPVIGDNCFIGRGAKVLGRVIVGRDSVIGANAVVLQDVPERSCVVGIPARVIRTNIDIHEYRTRSDMGSYVPE